MSSVVTELVIDADTTGADQFSQSMDSAHSSAVNTTLAVAGVGVAFVGSLAALRGFVDYVGSVNKQLIDISENATNAGMATQEFQQTLFAARSSGVSEKDFVSGLDKIGADLTAASRGVTDFGKLFEQNGLSIKDANGELKTTKTALADISSLMQNATPAIQQGVARIVGLSKDWVPFLREGVDAMDAQKKAASDLGVIIGDDVISKAKEFDAQWKTAIATWDLQFKASLASIMPLLVQMATLASKIIDGVGSVSSSVSRWLTPDDDKTKSQLNDQINDVARLQDMMTRLGDNPAGFGGLKVRTLKGLVGLPEDSNMEDVFKLLDKLSALYDKTPARIEIFKGGTTVLPPTDENDAVDRAYNQLQKHTQQQLADAEAIGKGDAALARFRAEAAETAAVLANDGKETDEQIDKWSDLKDAAEAAAEALSKAKVASSISVGRQTAFLSSGDVAIAQQLRGLYGDNIPAALASTEYAALKVNAALREVSSGIENNLTSGLTDIVSGTKSASQGFTDMSNSIIKAIEQMIIKITIVEPLMRGLQQAAGGLGGLGGLSGFFGSGSGSLAGSVSSGTGLGAGTGGLAFPMFADGTDSAPGGWSIVGDKGPELVNLSPGAQVVPHGAWSGGGSNDNRSRVPNIIINNHTDAQPQVATGSNGDITITMKKAVDDMVGESLSSGTGMRVLKKQYGVTPFSGQ